MKTIKELEALSATLKETHKKVYKAEVYLDGEATEESTRTIFLRKPNRLERKIATDIATKKGLFDAVEVYAKSMYLGGDDLAEILKNDDAFASLTEIIGTLIETVPGNLTAL